MDALNCVVVFQVMDALNCVIVWTMNQNINKDNLILTRMKQLYAH